MASTPPASERPPPFAALPSAPTGQAFALLAGARVLDLTTSIAGPYATLLLADMGAEIVKIERPGAGDDTRAWGPPFLDGESLWFIAVNRSKRSLTLDYAGDAGRTVLHELVRHADVVIVNQVPRTQTKLGVDYATLAALKPDLVHVSLTGFGLTGARRERPCYDIIAEGYSSVMDITGEAVSDPQKIGTPAADLLSGMDAAYATVCALFDRQRTGRGHAIDVSMVESMTRFMSPRIVPYLGSGDVPKRSGAKDSVIAIYQVFHTADEPITLGLGNDNLWKRFWVAVGRESYGDDPRFKTNVDRRAVRGEIVAEIQRLLLTKLRAEWLAMFDAAGVPAGPINRADQVTQDPDLIERGLFYKIDTDRGPVPQVGLGIRIDGAAGYHRAPPPRLGADSGAVLDDWLGYDTAQIAALRDNKVI
ncbi:MAG: CoA transferase [Burkholderiales bacterium]